MNIKKDGVSVPHKAKLIVSVDRKTYSLDAAAMDPVEEIIRPDISGSYDNIAEPDLSLSLDNVTDPDKSLGFNNIAVPGKSGSGISKPEPESTGSPGREVKPSEPGPPVSLLREPETGLKTEDTRGDHAYGRTSSDTTSAVLEGEEPAPQPDHLEDAEEKQGASEESEDIKVEDKEDKKVEDKEEDQDTPTCKEMQESSDTEKQSSAEEASSSSWIEIDSVKGNVPDLVPIKGEEELKAQVPVIHPTVKPEGLKIKSFVELKENVSKTTTEKKHWTTVDGEMQKTSAGKETENS